MSGSDLNNPIVLVVEDNEDIRYFMRLALEGRGYRVCEAENGEQAIAIAGREQPNAILMDLVCRLLLEKKKISHVPLQKARPALSETPLALKRLSQARVG